MTDARHAEPTPQGGAPNSVRIAEIRKRLEAATIPGFPGYEAHQDGSIWSVFYDWRGYGHRRLGTTLNSYGYPRVRLTVDGKRTSKSVHSLIALAFLPSRPSNEHQIRHLNGDKTDSRLENIEWGTAQENADDRKRHGRNLVGSVNHQAKLSEESVSLIRAEIEKGTAPKKIAIRFGVHVSGIHRIARGESWIHV